MYSSFRFRVMAGLVAVGPGAARDLLLRCGPAHRPHRGRAGRPGRGRAARREEEAARQRDPWGGRRCARGLRGAHVFRGGTGNGFGFSSPAFRWYGLR